MIPTKQDFSRCIAWPQKPRYEISRWLGGNHYYVKSDTGEDITDGTKVKFDTWEEADEAGKKWADFR